MSNPEHHTPTVHTERFSVLAPVPPFVDIILRAAMFDAADFSSVAEMAAGYPNDPRMIEMVREAGDASAKVPYLMAEGETAQSILSMLCDVAQPHIEHLHRLPGAFQSTVNNLLSLKTVPRGCEAYAIPALLEIDRMQGKMIKTLRELMVGRKLAEDFYNDNKVALQMLDADWPHLRKSKNSPWPTSQPLPEHAQMQYVPIFHENRLERLYETCVIVKAPGVHTLKRFIPPVLQRPLAVDAPAPVTGTAEWLIRDVGKIGRHCTRALLKIITDRLEAEQIALDAHNYELVNRHALDALRDFVGKTP